MARFKVDSKQMLAGWSLLCASSFSQGLFSQRLSQRYFPAALFKEHSATFPHRKGETFTQRIWYKYFIKEGMHFQKSFPITIGENMDATEQV